MPCTFTNDYGNQCHKIQAGVKPQQFVRNDTEETHQNNEGAIQKVAIYHMFIRMTFFIFQLGWCYTTCLLAKLRCQNEALNIQLLKCGFFQSTISTCHHLGKHNVTRHYVCKYFTSSFYSNCF